MPLCYVSRHEQRHRSISNPSSFCSSVALCAGTHPISNEAFLECSRFMERWRTEDLDFLKLQNHVFIQPLRKHWWINPRLLQTHIDPKMLPQSCINVWFCNFREY